MTSKGLLTLAPNSASYNASKAALVHYGNTLRVEMAPLGSVASIIPNQILYRAESLIACEWSM